MKQVGQLELGISVRDIASLRSFYEEALSFTCEVDVELPAPVATMTGLSSGAVKAAWLRAPGGERVKLFQTEQPAVARTSAAELLGVEGIAYLTFYVEDAAATVKDCVAAGGQAVGAETPVDLGQMKVAFVRDPEGNVVELVERVG